MEAVVVAAALGQVEFAVSWVDLRGRQLGRYLGTELGDGLGEVERLGLDRGGGREAGVQLEGPVRDDIEPDHVHLEDGHDGRAEGGLVAGVGPLPTRPCSSALNRTNRMVRRGRSGAAPSRAWIASSAAASTPATPL